MLCTTSIVYILDRWYWKHRLRVPHSCHTIGGISMDKKNMHNNSWASYITKSGKSSTSYMGQDPNAYVQWFHKILKSLKAIVSRWTFGRWQDTEYETLIHNGNFLIKRSVKGVTTYGKLWSLTKEPWLSASLSLVFQPYKRKGIHFCGP